MERISSIRAVRFRLSSRARSSALSTAGRCEGIHPLEAIRRGLIPADAIPALMSKTADLLASAGFTDTLPRPGHFLLTLLPDGTLARDPDLTPTIRVCTFETLRPLG